MPVLDYSHFGDTSDFRGIGADQARFRRMGAMKVAAFLELLQLGREVRLGLRADVGADPCRCRSRSASVPCLCPRLSS